MSDMSQWVYPSTGLKQADFDEHKIITTYTKPEMRYAWDEGVAMGRFLEELKNGRLIARVCHRCRRVLLPPRMFCERCFRPTDAWVYVGDTGTIKTFSLCYITWNMIELTEPQIPCVIDIDGASRGMGLMHLLGDVDPQAVRIGMRVQAVWKQPEERQGAITDIAYWKPMEK